jgi:parvulin-like peptidyl-prolyl isomerase
LLDGRALPRYSPRVRSRSPWRLGVLAILFVVPFATAAGCNEKAVERTPDAGTIPGGLTPEQASKPLAKFGDHVITLGDFAQALADMPEYERMRYQSLERRKELLRSMIDVYLLADEAKKEGLDKDPQVEEETRQILVAWMRQKLLQGLPPPAGIPAADVRSYYDAHLDEFRQPERRRVAQIVTSDEAVARKAYDETKAATPTAWGGLVRKYSDDKPAVTSAPEMAGDLGFVTSPDDTHPPSSAKITPELRAVAFSTKDVGDVAAPFKDGNGWHVLKLLVREPAHEQAYADVEKSIRIRLLQDMRTAKEKAVLDETKASTNVQIDDDALAAVANSLSVEPAPSTSTSTAPSTNPSTSASSSASVSASASASGKPKTK